MSEFKWRHFSSEIVLAHVSAGTVSVRACKHKSLCSQTITFSCSDYLQISPPLCSHYSISRLGRHLLCVSHKVPGISRGNRIKCLGQGLIKRIDGSRLYLSQIGFYF
jgi:hypothetical protein